MKRFACIAAILLLLVICGIASAEEDDELPAEIKQYFDNETSIVEIEDFSYSKQFLFAIAKNSNKERVLYGFQQNEGQWDFIVKTKSVFPDTNLQAYVSTDEEYQDFNGIHHVPFVMLGFSDPKEDFTRILVLFEYDGNAFTLNEVNDYNNSASVRYKQNTVMIYDDDSCSSQKADIKYSMPTSLSDFDYENFIAYINKWNKEYYTLTNQVNFDENFPLRYYHPNDQIFTVYSAPTSAAYIEANGKAKVSTNDWILVYGKENDYYLIQYSINETAMRYGYIPSSSLAYLNMGKFIWANQEATVKKKTNLINDPCGSKTKTRSLQEGTKIKILGILNEWAYIECQTPYIVRGFVDYKALNIKTGL